MLFDSRYPRSTRHWKVNSISSWQKHLFKLLCSWRYDAYSVFRQWVLGCGLWKICLIMGDTSSGYEHPVLLQLSVVIYIKLSFLGLWHQVQTYFSYRWLQPLLPPVWLCPWDAGTCGSQHCGAAGAHMGPTADGEGRVVAAACQSTRAGPPPVVAALDKGPSLHSASAHHSCKLFQAVLQFSLCFASSLWITNGNPVGNAILWGKGNAEGEKTYSLAFFSPAVYYWIGQDWKY